MKILWLYRYIPTYDFDHNLHMSFAKFIAGYPGVTLKAYGPKIHEGYNVISLIDYKPEYTLGFLKGIYDFDVIVICTKSRMFLNYNPHINVAEECWLPRDFKDYKCAKVVLEEDYHYEKNDNWYFENNVNLILQRHYSQSLRKDKVKMEFLPFSVDIAAFNSWTTVYPHGNSILKIPLARRKNIGFCGSHMDKAYIYRKNAIEKLMNHGLAISYSKAGVIRVAGEYLQILRSHVGYVSCGSTYQICAAKNFEIMACGGVLLTNKFQGIELIYPENTYVSYKEDMSDIVDKAKKILNEPDYVTQIVTNARECIMNCHTHDIRLKQLLEILRGL